MTPTAATSLPRSCVVLPHHSPAPPGPLQGNAISCLLPQMCARAATTAQLMSGTLERRAKNSSDLKRCSQGLSWQLTLHLPSLLKTSQLEGMCVGGWGRG